MRAYDCPQCGAAVKFLSSVTVFATCGFCRSMVVRRDVDVELMGQQATLPPDLSPLQIGTRGEFHGAGFTLVGRVRVGYAEGSWNEWCADFGDGRWGWIAEAQGFYLASFEVAVPPGFPGSDQPRLTDDSGDPALQLVNFRLSQGREAMSLGRQVAIAGVSYQVRDTKQTRVISSEGELPFTALPGRTAISADLGGPEAAFANAEYSDDGIRLFVGRCCRFAELKFTELRPLPGWTTERFEPERNQSDALNCPSCGAPTALRAAGLTMTAVCGNCASLLDTSNPQLQLIALAEKRQVFKPLIPLGTRGRFDGVELECIGFMRRRDNYGEAWFEYLLYNPFAGFRWLVTYGGHWCLVDTLLTEPREVDGAPVVDATEFKLFANATAEVTYVLGEFYWQVRLRERTLIADFIAPPAVLSREQYPDLAEVAWSAGTYVTPQAVREAFNLPAELVEPVGVYLNQPNPHREKGRTLRWLLPLLAAVFVVIQLFFATTRANETVFSGNFHYVAGDTNRVQVTPVFEVKGDHRQAVRIATAAPVDNQWLEVGYDLVNADTKEVAELVAEVEYYHGYDDGPWSEGSQTSADLFPAVKPGRYYLAVEPTADPGLPVAMISTTVVRDVTVWSNFWLGLGGLLAYPLFRWLREHSFERARWSQSDFSPFASAGSDDDDD